MANLTIKDIAKICGVGTSTVSRAINNDPGINPVTKERILRVVEEFHYVPNNAARNLKLTENNAVGVLVKGLNNQFFLSMFRIFEEELGKKGYTFVLKEMSSDQDEATVAEELVKEKRLKGIIFMGGMIENPDVTLKRLDIPYVLCTVAVNANIRDSASVSIDDEKESFRIVDYLCKLGHKRIAIITGRRNDYAVGGLRLDGYKRALASHGIPYDANLVGYMKDDIPDFTAQNGYVVMKEMLASGEDFTAVYAISDLTAFGAYKAIDEAGKNVPEDYSVVGFDGIDLTEYMTPALTTMAQPKEDLARATVEMLIKEIDGIDTQKKVVFPAEFIERDSVRKI